MKCEKCKEKEAVVKVYDREDNQEKDICEECVTYNMIELERLNGPAPESPPPSEEGVVYGRLHLVKRTRKEFQCRECKNLIPAGSSCYSQKKEMQSMPFPLQTRVCMACGALQIQRGVEVAPSKTSKGEENGN